MTPLIPATFDNTCIQDRPLFAVPGNAGFPSNRGTNSLIKQGAVVIENARGILSGFNVSSRAVVQACRDRFRAGTDAGRNRVV